MSNNAHSKPSKSKSFPVIPATRYQRFLFPVSRVCGETCDVSDTYNDDDTWFCVIAECNWAHFSLLPGSDVQGDRVQKVGTFMDSAIRIDRCTCLFTFWGHFLFLHSSFMRWCESLEVGKKNREKKKKKKKGRKNPSKKILSWHAERKQSRHASKLMKNRIWPLQSRLLYQTKDPDKKWALFTNGNPAATARPPPAFDSKREKSQAGPRSVSESAMHTASATDSVESLATPDTPGGSRPGRHRGLENRNNSAKLSVSADVNQPPSGEHRGSSRQLLNVEGNKYNTIHNNS